MTGQVATPTKTNITCLNDPVWVKASLVFSVTLLEILAKMLTLFQSISNPFRLWMEDNNSNTKYLIKQFILHLMVSDPGSETQIYMK